MTPASVRDAASRIYYLPKILPSDNQPDLNVFRHRPETVPDNTILFHVCQPGNTRKFPGLRFAGGIDSFCCNVALPIVNRLALVCCCLSSGLSVWGATVASHGRQLLLMPRHGAALPGLNALHAARQAQVVRVFPTLADLQVVRLRNEDHVADAIARYQASGLVDFAEPDYVVSVAATLPSDPYFQNGTQWWLNNYGQNGGVPGADLNAPQAWDVARSASNVVVAIVDSGIRYTHEDLVENLWADPHDGSHGYNAFTGSRDPWDDNGHGTHLAGIIGATTDNARGSAGIAWRVQIMACKFLDGSGNGYISDALSCMEFALTNGAQIINLSWGNTEFSAALSNAIHTARAQNVLVVAAAGNNGQNTDLTPFYPASIQLDNLLSVGASTRLDARWSASNYGAASVDLFAPGAEILSTGIAADNAYQNRNGTSMATACVAGALALMRQQFPDAPAAELRTWLLTAVDSRPAFLGKCASGGRLNLRKILDRPGLTSVAGAARFTARITGQPNHRYTLAASTNLAIWTAIQTNLLPTSGEWIFEETQTNIPQRFFRATAAP